MSLQFEFIDGMAYIPIPCGYKSPIFEGWNLRENCITTAEEASGLLAFNVALAHAYCSPITCALDIDHMPSAITWFDARGIDLESLLESSSGVIALSGRANSVKAFYSMPSLTGALTSLC